MITNASEQFGTHKYKYAISTAPLTPSHDAERNSPDVQAVTTLTVVLSSQVKECLMYH